MDPNERLRQIKADAWDEGFLIADGMDRAYRHEDRRTIPDHLVGQMRYWNPYRTEYTVDPFEDVS